MGDRGSDLEMARYVSQHNNTTPDDIYICEAYLTFLSRGGDNAAYWEHLNKNGITRERMESFERPIIAEPEDFHWMRDALIGEGS